MNKYTKQAQSEWVNKPTKADLKIEQALMVVSIFLLMCVVW